MSAKSNFEKTPEEFAEEIKKVLSANVSKSIQLMTRANNLIKDTVESISTADGKSVNESELLERWLNFNVATYTVINDHAVSLLEKLISVAESSMTGKQPEKDQEKKPVDIKITGRPGEKHSAYFLVQNHYDHPLEISFEASPLLAQNGTILSNSHISFEPDSTALKQNEQMTIKINADITKEFVPDLTYTTTIRVLGFEAKELVLTIDILQPETSGSEQPKTKTTPKKAKAKASTGKRTPGRSKKPDNQNK